VDLHQQPVGGLAERHGGHGSTRRLLGGAQLAAALAQPGLGEHLERPHAHRVELAAALGDPRPLAVGQEGLQVDGEDLARGARRGGPVVRVDRRLGAGGGSRRLLDVDLERHRGHEAQLGAAHERPVAERAAQLREQRAERAVGRRRRALRPQQVDQLGAPAAAIAVEHEIREQQPPLPSRKR
jgi:hypothetical protein